MNAFKFYKIGFFTVLILNIALLILILILPIIAPPPPRPMMPRVLRELKLDRQQRAQFHLLAKEHHQSMKELRREIRSQLQDYFAGLKENEVDKRAEALEKIKKLETERLAITYAHFEDIKSLCRPEQLEGFPRIVDQALHLISPPSGKIPSGPKD
ncbi:MAG: periplasmic heavy metal sensor [Bacteroidota bacterium]